MTGTLRINGKTIKATHFAYDGCHKIYLIGNASQFSEMLGYGYRQSDIHPVSKLQETWAQTCPLRFISWADLGEVVPQSYDKEPRIEWSDK